LLPQAVRAGEAENEPHPAKQNAPATAGAFR
jgi:hypothetical protein